MLQVANWTETSLLKQCVECLICGRVLRSAVVVVGCHSFMHGRDVSGSREKRRRNRWTVIDCSSGVVGGRDRTLVEESLQMQANNWPWIRNKR